MKYEFNFSLNDITSYENFSNLPSDYKLPRVYGLRNTDENKEIYNQLINHIGKKIRMESDRINGLFETSLDGDEIVLREVVK